MGRRRILALGLVGFLGYAAPAVAVDLVSLSNSESITNTASFFDANLTGSSKSRLSVTASGIQGRLSSIIVLPEDMIFLPETGLTLSEKDVNADNSGDVTAWGYFLLDGYRMGDESTFSVDACGTCVTYSVSQQQ